MTDVGEFAKSELTITPAANGSYFVRRSGGDRSQYLPNPIDEIACFTNYSDLLNFLCTEYNAANASGARNPADEGDGV